MKVDTSEGDCNTQEIEDDPDTHNLESAKALNQ